jgi:hypothetical protein
MPISDQIPQVTFPDPNFIPASQDPAQWRKHMFDIREQLNLLYDDVVEGRFGEAAQLGAFATYIKTIKDQFPKA